MRKLVPMSGFDELCCDSCSNTRPSAIQVNTQHGSAAQRMLFKNCRTDVIRHIIGVKHASVPDAEGAGPHPRGGSSEGDDRDYDFLNRGEFREQYPGKVEFHCEERQGMSSKHVNARQISNLEWVKTDLLRPCPSSCSEGSQGDGSPWA